MKNLLRIKEVLKSRGMTINDLANIMEINRVTLSNMINGNPTLDTLQKIASHVGVGIAELFSTIQQDCYSITKNDFDSHFIYDDENIFLNGFLPHLTQREIGTFVLEIKRKDFSIISSTREVKQLLESDRTIEEILFKGYFNSETLIQLFSSYTSLTRNEYDSICNALKFYLYFHKQFLNELNIILGVSGFGEPHGRYYNLGMLDRESWYKLIKLTKIYDLDSNKKGFEKFNANGNDIIMFNMDIQKGYNIKMWISPIEKHSTNEKVMLGWRAPDYLDRDLIKTEAIFNAKRSYDFIHNKMLPMIKNI